VKWSCFQAYICDNHATLDPLDYGWKVTEWGYAPICFDGLVASRAVLHTLTSENNVDEGELGSSNI